MAGEEDLKKENGGQSTFEEKENGGQSTFEKRKMAEVL